MPITIYNAPTLTLRRRSFRFGSHSLQIRNRTSLLTKSFSID
jgi:hypothetical protein